MDAKNQKIIYMKKHQKKKNHNQNIDNQNIHNQNRISKHQH